MSSSPSTTTDVGVAAAGSSMNNLLLDSEIRDWVVLPLFVIMVATGMLRFYMGNWLKSAPKDFTKVQQRTQASVRATSTLKTGAIHFLSTSKLEARKTAYPEVLKEQAEWCEKHLDDVEEEKSKSKDGTGAAGGATADDDDMPNPFAAMEGMKGNMIFMVQNMAMMQAIQTFFSGFILLKVPFRLTVGFKQMFQRGLEGLSTLDTSYVSSVSWYFLVMFGLRGFFRLVIGNPTLETQECQQLWHKLGKKPSTGGPPQGPEDDAVIQQLRTEADNLELMLPKHFKSNLDQVEKRLLQNKYPKRKTTLGKENDFLLHTGTKKNK